MGIQCRMKIKQFHKYYKEHISGSNSYLIFGLTALKKPQSNFQRCLFSYIECILCRTAEFYLFFYFSNRNILGKSSNL